MVDKRERFLEELAEDLNISKEEVLEAVDQLEIDIFETPEEAYVQVMALEDMSKENLIAFFLNVIKEDVSEISPIVSWLENYNGIFYTDNGVAYINQSFYK